MGLKIKGAFKPGIWHNMRFGVRSSAAIIKANRNFTLAIETQKLYASGNNFYGQLGTPLKYKTTDKQDNVVITEDARKVDCGLYHSAYIDTSGVLWTAGYNRYGQLGVAENVDTDDGISSWQDTGIEDAVDVACGDYHTLVLLKNGDLYSAGQNLMGQCGTGSTSEAITSFTKVKSSVKAIAAGQHHTLIIDNTSTAFGIGYNRYGQLGTEENHGTDTPVTTWQQFGTGASVIACGSNHSFITKDNVAYGFGHNYYQQLGTDETAGTNTGIFIPSAIAVGTVTKIECSSSGTMLMTGSGEVWRCGYNEQNQMGHNAQETLPLSKVVSKDAASIGMGTRHGFWVHTDGTIYVSGENNYYQCFAQDNSSYSIFTPIGKLENI